MGLLEKVFGDLNKKEVRKIEKIVDKIEALDEEMQSLSDAELKGKTDEFKEKMRRDEIRDMLFDHVFQDRACQRRPFFRIGPRPQLVDQDERFRRRRPQDPDNIRHMPGKCRERLFDRLLVADIGENVLENRKRRADRDRKSVV